MNRRLLREAVDACRGNITPLTGLVRERVSAYNERIARESKSGVADLRVRAEEMKASDIDLSGVFYDLMGGEDNVKRAIESGRWGALQHAYASGARTMAQESTDSVYGPLVKNFPIAIELGTFLMDALVRESFASADTPFHRMFLTLGTQGRKMQEHTDFGIFSEDQFSDSIVQDGEEGKLYSAGSFGVVMPETAMRRRITQVTTKTMIMDEFGVIQQNLMNVGEALAREAERDALRNIMGLDYYWTWRVQNDRRSSQVYWYGDGSTITDDHPYVNAISGFDLQNFQNVDQLNRVMKLARQPWGNRDPMPGAKVKDLLVYYEKEYTAQYIAKMTAAQYLTQPAGAGQTVGAWQTIWGGSFSPHTSEYGWDILTKGGTGPGEIPGPGFFAEPISTAKYFTYGGDFKGAMRRLEAKPLTTVSQPGQYQNGVILAITTEWFFVHYVVNPMLLVFGYNTVDASGAYSGRYALTA